MKAIFRHTIRFYEELEARSYDEDGLTVFRGHPTRVVTDELDMPLPYYSRMREMLITLECIKQIRRGSAKSESEWVLVRRPEPADFDAIDPEVEREKLTNKELRLWRLSVEGQLANMEGGLNVVRAQLDEIRQSLVQLKESANNGNRI